MRNPVEKLRDIYNGLSQQGYSASLSGYVVMLKHYIEDLEAENIPYVEQTTSNPIGFIHNRKQKEELP